MCGLPPFVDEMIDVFIDDGIVFVGIPRLFTRPLRLTAPEGFTLLTAGRAAMELPGADPSGPLGRGLDKLAVALGGVGLGRTGDDTAGVVVDLARPEFADELAEAAAVGRELVIEYYTPSRDEVSERTVVPRHVFVDGGNWYALADDGASGERRTFRIDRIESARATGRLVGSDEVVEAPDQFFVDADVPRAVLRLERPARWVVEEYPVDEVTELRNGQVEVRLPVSSDRWLAKLLIRSGPNAVLVEPAGWTVARELAEVMLARYGETIERRELLGVDDAVRSQEVGEYRCGGERVTERIVRPLERDVVAGADVGETMRLFVRRIETSRHPQRAQGRVETPPERVGRRTVATGPSRNPASKAALCAVNRDPSSRALSSSSASSRAGAPSQGLAGDAVDLGGTDTLQRPTELDEATTTRRARCRPPAR